MSVVFPDGHPLAKEAARYFTCPLCGKASGPGDVLETAMAPWTHAPCIEKRDAVAMNVKPVCPSCGEPVDIESDDAVQDAVTGDWWHQACVLLDHEKALEDGSR